MKIKLFKKNMKIKDWKKLLKSQMNIKYYFIYILGKVELKNNFLTEHDLHALGAVQFGFKWPRYWKYGLNWQ